MASAGRVSISDESKIRLQNQVADLLFVDKPYKLDTYKCCSCEHVAIDYCLSNCNHVFCNKCYLKHFKKPCPKCKTTIEQRTQDSEFELEMLQLKVSCKFKKNGCGEIVALGDFLDHISICKLATKKLLPKVYKEKGEIPAEQLKQLILDVRHNNDEIKKLDKKLDELQEINQLIKKDAATQHHKLGSANGKATNQNQEKMKKSEQKLKKDEDAMHLMQEEIKKLKGAHEIAMKKNQEDLEKMMQLFKNNTAIGLIQSKYEKLENAHGIAGIEIKKNQEKLQKMKLMLKNDKGDSSCKPLYEFLWRISGFDKKLKTLINERHATIQSEKPFSIYENLNVTPELSYERSIDTIAITLNIHPENGSIPYLHSRKYVLLDQSDSVEKTDVEFLDRPLFRKNSANDIISKKFWFTHFFKGHLLFKSENRYLKNDEIQIKVIFEPISLFYKEVASFAGTLFWRIDNFSKRKQDEIDGTKYRLLSKPFKTSENGYTMQVQMHLNGYGIGINKHISMYMGFMLGEWDEFLQCPFKYNLSGHILDQSDDNDEKMNISKEVKCHEFKANQYELGFVEFAAHSVVENPKYLKNDTLLLKVVVEIL